MRLIKSFSSTPHLPPFPCSHRLQLALEWPDLSTEVRVIVRLPILLQYCEIGPVLHLIFLLPRERRMQRRRRERVPPNQPGALPTCRRRSRHVHARQDSDTTSTVGSQLSGYTCLAERSDTASAVPEGQGLSLVRLDLNHTLSPRSSFDQNCHSSTCMQSTGCACGC